MNEIIFGITYTIIALLAVYSIKHNIRKNPINTLISIALMIVSGLYIPLNNNKGNYVVQNFVKRHLNTIKK